LRVVVVGGGLSGLFTGSHLTAAGLDDVVVVEASPHAGGVTRTVRRDGFSLEPGVGSFSLPDPGLSPILDRAGVETKPVVAGARYVFTDGELMELEPSPRLLLTPLLSLPAKLRAAAEILVPSRTNPEESLAGFCRRRFGRGAGDMVSWLMASGVFAGDPTRLSAMAAFPVLEELELEASSVIRGALRRRRRMTSRQPRSLHVAVGGMARLADQVADTMGDRFRPDFAVKAVRQHGDRWVVEGPEKIAADIVVLAVSPQAAAELVDSDLAGVLSRARSAPVAVVGLGGPGSSPFPSGFGALIGPDENLATRGVLFESSYAPDRAPNGSWFVKAIVGGATRPDVSTWSEQRVADHTIREAGIISGGDVAPSFVEAIWHQPGIPQYETGHLHWLSNLDALVGSRPGLRVTGWGYRGVGVASLAMEATRLAREIVS
jgi:protoporphyrinogen/coproporphyrinogen III oxidase